MSLFVKFNRSETSCMKCLTVTFGITEGQDEFHWNLQSNEKFYVSLLYNVIIQLKIPVDKNKKIWKTKIPLKIKIFGW
jgi:hypothetical protein